MDNAENRVRIDRRGCCMAQLRRRSRGFWRSLALGLGLAASCATAAWATVQTTPLPLQGVLRSSAGTAVTDGVYALTISLYDQKAATTPVWKQTFASVAVAGGLFAVELGADPLLPLPAALTATPAPLWFGVTVGSEPELPRSAIGWVPRALWANVAAVAQDLGCVGCVGTADLGAASVTAEKVAFNYAGAASAGGAATSALTALAADSAKTADKATTADSAATALTAGSADSAKTALTADTATSAATAGSADTATKAATADVANDLQCSGCVAVGELGSDVAAKFVGKSGDTLTGIYSLTGLLNINGILNLGSTTTILGGMFGPWSLCDSTHTGAFGWDSTASRFSICDGSAMKKLAFCGESCLAPEKVACGATIPDICGDACTGPGAGKGTLCSTAGEQCQNNVCGAVPRSCAAILAAGQSTGTKVYTIDPDGPGGVAPFSAYCDMGNDGGGWTLVLKISGGNSTFNYDSGEWASATPYNPGGYAFDQASEHKSAAYATLGFSAVRVTMYAASYQTVAFPQGGTSLLALFGGDTYQPTTFGRSAWQGLVTNGALLANCNREGFNVRPWSNPGSPGSVYADAFNSGVLRARFGILTNNENDCKTPDAVIGFGISGVACSTHSTTAAGNFAFCGALPFDNNVSAWAYVFVR